MSAFLYISANQGGRAQRVDLGNIASLFAESEEVAPPAGTARVLLRAAAVVLLLLLAIGDTLLVARPAALGPGVAPVAARVRT